jgi:hypothetical protein
MDDGALDVQVPGGNIRLLLPGAAGVVAIASTAILTVTAMRLGIPSFSVHYHS